MIRELMHVQEKEGVFDMAVVSQKVDADTIEVIPHGDVIDRCAGNRPSVPVGGKIRIGSVHLHEKAHEREKGSSILLLNKRLFFSSGVH